MLNKKFIKKYAEQNNIPLTNSRRLLTEYLQTEILQILYNSQYGKHLTFMGGTCLRFVYRIERFSEDLDFDLISNKDFDFQKLADYFEKELKRLGFIVDTRVKETENIFIIFIKFSQVMKQIGVSELDNQKLKIKFKVDSSPLKNIKYKSEIISAYGKNFNVIVNTLETLFAQKLLALFLRPYQKGRDFYDLIWFLAQKNIEPNYKILQEKGFKIKNEKELIEKMEEVISKLDLKQASRDVERFLFYPEQAKWILDFNKYLQTFKSYEKI